MGRYRLLLFVLILVSAPRLSAQSELWSRAAALAAQSHDLVPGTLTSVVAELNGDGTPKSTIEMTMSMTYDSRGAVEKTEIVQAIRDGKDVTEEMRANAEKSGRPGGGQGNAWVGFSGMLFTPETAKKIHFLPDVRSVHRGDRTYQVVAFEIGVNLLAKLKGTAEIDPQTGVPSIVHAAGQMPFVRDLSMTMTYSPFPSGGFVLTTLEFGGSVTIPFRKGGFRGSLTFSDYQRVGVSSAEK